MKTKNIILISLICLVLFSFNANAGRIAPLQFFGWDEISLTAGAWEDTWDYFNVTKTMIYSFKTFDSTVTSGSAIQGTSSAGDGVMGVTTSDSASGVYGETSAAVGSAAISGRATGGADSYGVKGWAQNGYSGHFSGPIGNLGVKIENGNLDMSSRDIDSVNDLSCTTCIDTTDIRDDAVTASKVQFSWAVSSSEGGSASNAESCSADAVCEMNSASISGNIDMNNNKIENLATPTADSDAVTKNYVDSLGSGGGVPIGTVISFLKDYAGAAALAELQADGWAFCEGTTPAAQGLIGAVITTTPNLNGQNQFLRGADTSGGTGGSASHSHLSPVVFGGDGHHLKATWGYGGGSSAAGSIAFNWGSNSNRPHMRTSSASSLPPYYDVVWLIKVK